MDAQELRNLQEAYLEVVENQQLNEGYKIYSNRKVQDKMDKLKSKGDLESVGRAGQIRDKLIKRSFSSQIPDKEEKLNRNKSEKYKRSKTVSDNTEKKKSFPNRLTRSDKQGIRDSYDYYDIILSHLLDEGYAETPEAAKSIMANMSEEWRESILDEEFLDERNRGEQGMSDREVTRRRNLGGNVRSKVSASSLGDHGSQSAIQKFHKTKANQRRAIHKSGRYTRGDTGESGGQGRYQANKDHSDGYPSITKRGQGPG